MFEQLKRNGPEKVKKVRREDQVNKDDPYSAKTHKNCLGEKLGRVSFNSTRYKKVTPGEKMTAVSTKPSETKDDLPDKIAEMEFDTGTLEIGYDRKTDQTVLSFVHDEWTTNSKMVGEDRAFRTRELDCEQSRTNDKTRSQGAMDLRSGAYKNYNVLNRQFDRITNETDHTSTMDKVIPFNQDKEEKEEIENLKSMKNLSKGENEEIENRISEEYELQAKKSVRKMDFTRKLRSSIDDVKKMRLTNNDYLVYLKKRWMEMNGLTYVADDSDGDNNNGDEKNNINLEDQETREDKKTEKDKEVSEDIKDAVFEGDENEAVGKGSKKGKASGRGRKRNSEKDKK